MEKRINEYSGFDYSVIPPYIEYNENYNSRKKLKDYVIRYCWYNPGNNYDKIFKHIFQDIWKVE